MALYCTHQKKSSQNLCEVKVIHSTDEPNARQVLFYLQVAKVAVEPVGLPLQAQALQLRQALQVAQLPFHVGARQVQFLELHAVGTEGREVASDGFPHSAQAKTLQHTAFFGEMVYVACDALEEEIGSEGRKANQKD